MLPMERMFTGIRRWFGKFRKARHLELYVQVCGPRLRQDYGPQDHYSAGQVLTVLDVCRANRELADYALAMFLTREAFVQAIQKREAQAVNAGRSAGVAKASAPYRSQSRTPKSEPARSFSELSALYDRLRKAAADLANEGNHHFLPRSEETVHLDNQHGVTNANSSAASWF